MHRFFRIVASCLFVCSCLASRPALAQDVRHEIHFPDLPGFVTLKCDLHMHTVFSDGTVWPPIRVAEAWRQGLDVISITDHIEYQPHKDDVKTQHGRSYDLAVGGARGVNLLLIKGAEITRETPPGHFNALFVKDVSKLDTKEFLDAMKAAAKQDAFVFWNHQAWKGEEKGRWLDVHTTLFESKLFQGMEVCNGSTYFPTAHKWCLEKNLVIIGNSDIHEPDLRTKSTSDDHRTMTLVFARERTLPAVDEALRAGRTAVWFQDQIIGRKEYLELLFHGAVEIVSPVIRTGKTTWLQLRNTCDADINLARSGTVGPATILLPARVTTLVRFNTATPDTPLDLKYTATNFVIAPGTGLPVELKTDGTKPTD